MDTYNKYTYASNALDYLEAVFIKKNIKLFICSRADMILQMDNGTFS